MYDTTHSNQRKSERNILDEPVAYLYKKGIDFISSGKADPNRDILVFSKSKYQQAIIVSFRKDKYAKEVTIKTILPPKKNFANQKTTQKHIVERFSQNVEYSDKLLDYIRVITKIKSSSDKYDYHKIIVAGIEFIFVNNKLDNICYSGIKTRIFILEVD